MIDKLKKALLIGGISLAGGAFYSGEVIENYFNLNENTSKNIYLTDNSELNENMKLMSENYFKKAKKSTSFEKARTEYENYKRAELEKILNEEERSREKEEFSQPFYLTEDSLNICIKQAQKNVGKTPKEIDKRLFRLMLKQESGYDIHVISPTGYMGIGQVGYDVIKTFRPNEWESFKDSITGEIDTLAVKKLVFNPVINLELSIQSLNFFANYCKKNDPYWEKSDLETKRRKILTCYNAGQENFKEADWNPKSEKLKKENRNYPEVIMNAYHNPAIKVKL
jgi:hypothetical protein